MAKLTVEEERLSESFILYELMRRVLENDLVKMNQAPVKLKTPYIHLVEQTLRDLSRELHETKRHMKRLNLKVELNSHDNTFSEYTIFYRGYALTAKYLNAHLKNQVSEKIEAWFLHRRQSKEGPVH
ncbi:MULTISPECIES: hypothetical protein [Alteribacter]|uniref:Uncharacterized protein n=1 Tax=Alteribacter keqinensis TaxID=2483800 RepID=A0A3M7TUV9_9BACI|nr:MULTISPECIES: hypothetical protein [Alteribacter]MBM7094331.1 hypothetical protein [Alteribacter salitolerans]RNA69438.1 hypothetical protein EBO34_05735 [Alteribacter keqinensis]